MDNWYSQYCGGLFNVFTTNKRYKIQLVEIDLKKNLKDFEKVPINKMGKVFIGASKAWGSFCT